jgi:hypothetical protein
MNKDRDWHGRLLPGHFQSVETNKKISIATRGRIIDKETRIKISKTKTGIKKLKEKSCLSCNKKFQPKRKRIKYCSISCSRKGKPSWNKGTKGICKSNSGSFKKDDIRISGANNHSWKGGITPINKAIRKSLKYKQWRKSVYDRDNYICVLCGGKGNGKNLNADHIKPFSLFPKLRFEVSNGRTLCKDCHEKTDTFSGRVNINIRDRNELGRFI